MRGALEDSLITGKNILIMAAILVVIAGAIALASSSFQLPQCAKGQSPFSCLSMVFEIATKR